MLRVDAAAVEALNAVDPAITLASLPDWSRVRPRQMVATVKIIPYAVRWRGGRAGVPGRSAGGAAVRVHGFRPARAALILTRTPGMKPALIEKGAEAVRARMAALGQTVASSATVAHETAAVAAAIEAAEGEMVLILGGSATSDASDVAPAGLVAAGGRLVRFGMPVDPGNLLFLGAHAGRPVVGTAGLRPFAGAERGRLGAGAAGGRDPGRGGGHRGDGGWRASQGDPGATAAARGPTGGGAAPGGGDRAGGGRGAADAGADKLLEPVGGRPVLGAVAAAAKASQADEVVVVLPPGAEARRAALAGLGVGIVEAPDWAEGMAASIRAGLAEVAGRADAVVILLADMPEVGAGDIDRLIAGFDPAEGREICRAVSAEGVPGHPVLFGRRFFEALAGLAGDRGAREVLREAGEFVTEVPTAGRGGAGRSRYSGGLGGLALRWCTIGNLTPTAQLRAGIYRMGWWWRTFVGFPVSAPFNQIDLPERRQIQICRVFCIFFMMSVHVHPGAGNPSIVSEGGAFALLGAIWSDTLGRASVAALSFISGYLLWRKAAGRSFGVVARDKARSLLVPMLVWNLVFVGLLLGRFLLTGRHGEAGHDPFAAGADTLSLLTGLDGETANRSLFFLRDLFVASLLVHLLGPLLRRYPLPLLAAIALVAVLDVGAPLIFRPSILLFVAAGMVVAQRGWHLDTLFVTRRLPMLVLPFGGGAGADRPCCPTASTRTRRPTSSAGAPWSRWSSPQRRFSSGGARAGCWSGSSPTSSRPISRTRPSSRSCGRCGRPSSATSSRRPTSRSSCWPRWRRWFSGRCSGG